MEKLIIALLILAVLGGGAYIVIQTANTGDDETYEAIDTSEDEEIPTVAPDASVVKGYDPEALGTPEAAVPDPVAEIGPEHTVSGKITDLNGAPVEGAEIRLLRYVHRPSAKIGRQKVIFDEDVKAKTLSGADGAYEFNGLETIAGPYLTLILMHPNYISVIKDKVGPGMIVNFQVTKGALITGKVTDIDTRKGIADVRLDVNYKRSSDNLHEYHRWRQVVHTDSQGNYEVKGSPFGELNVLLEHPDYTRTFIGRQQKLTIKQGQPNKLDFELKLGIVLNGLVIAADSKRPINKADVIMRDVIMAADRQRTGVLGKFRMKGVKRGPRKIEIRDVDGYTDYLTTIEVSDETSKKPTSFALLPCATASGIVVDDSGNPIEGADIYVAGMKALFLMVRNTSETKTAADGSFSVTNLNDKTTYAIAAHAPGMTIAATARFEAASGVETTDLFVQCQKGGSIQGRVVDDVGVPISGVHVSIEQPPFADVWFPPGLAIGQKNTFTLVTDDNGDYKAEDLYPGYYHVSPEHPDYIPIRAQRFHVADATETVTKDFTLKIGHTISGRVTDVYGNPAKGASVKGMLGPTSGQAINAQTDEDGNYTLRRLADAAYRVRASSENSISKTQRDVPCDSSGIDFVLEALGSLSGRVIAQGSGEPVQSFKITLLPELNLGSGQDARNERMRAKLTQSDEAYLESEIVSSSGEFNITGVLPGDYTVQVSCKSHREQFQNGVNVPPGAFGQVKTFLLQEGARYEGVMTDSAGNPLRSGDVNIRIMAAPGSTIATGPSGQRSRMTSAWKGKQGGLDSNGVFSIGGLPPGRVVVIFESEHYCMPSKKEAQFGQSGTTREDFTVMRGATATIRVLDEDGQSIPNPTGIINNLDGSRAQVDGRSVAGQGNRDGEIIIKKFLPGSYLVMIRRYGYEIQEVPLSVLEGESARSEVVLLKLR